MTEHLLKVCIGSVNVLKTLVEDFLDFTRIENETEIRIFKESIKLKEVFLFIKEMFEIQATEKGIDFRVNINDNVPDYYKTDPARLRQIMMNLASNALKFTSKGSIDITV